MDTLYFIASSSQQQNRHTGQQWIYQNQPFYKDVQMSASCTNLTWLTLSLSSQAVACRLWAPCTDYWLAPASFHSAPAHPEHACKKMKENIQLQTKPALKYRSEGGTEGSTNSSSQPTADCIRVGKLYTIKMLLYPHGVVWLSEKDLKWEG